MGTNLLRPDYIFETSWEVCNKVGGIHTVISTKALTLVNEYKSNYILIGPDVWRDTSNNPEFVEDTQLFKSWRMKVGEEGLHIKIGRWNISGNPIAVIVDFQSFTPQKDAIFSKFWETYRLDSLSGQWDYVEPALFGYAAGKVIESFVHFHLTIRDTVLAQFHEWMTGTGLLYLRMNMPQVATVFTTHATVLGRSIAGNQLPLYGALATYNPDMKASEFNVTAKQSLEKLSAQHANCFTTVSEITGKECSHFLDKDVDLVTPNGFEDSFVPQGEEYTKGRKVARDKMKEVAKALFGRISDHPLFVGIGGRYEFKNKGIDIFIKSLSELKAKSALNREVIAFVLIPANHYGPRRDLQNILSNPDEKNGDGKILTHNLHDADYDPVLREIDHSGLTNDADDKVKVIFVPCYLNGDDGIFNLTYYQLLIGLDLSVYPSYYEPWGYTPLESVAFHVPTITTTLAGFGLWVKEYAPAENDAVHVITRTDSNDEEMISAIAKIILSASHMNDEEKEQAREQAFQTSRIALWSNFVEYYKKAYDVALRNVQEVVIHYSPSKELIEDIPQVDKYQHSDNMPKWKRMLINKNIPQSLKALEELANNLWWCWNDDAEELFQSIHPDTWVECGKNPVVFLEHIPYDKMKELEKNKTFMVSLERIHTRFVEYMKEKEDRKAPQIAYFSMEYGLHSSLKIYSGGLGILAGDYLKEASDLNASMVAVGLLYRYGYFQQVISTNGEQLAFHDSQDFTKIPAIPMRDANGNWTTISIVFPGRTLYARVWKVQVGRVDLYLLDTDFEDNIEQDRSITHHLYGGGEENRFKQEILLGIGGIRALRALGLKLDVYHCNEGHAAFIGVERLFEYIHERNLTFAEALEIVRSSSLFTTHTPVPAGHDSFTEALMRMYVSHYPNKLKISWEQFMGLGKIHASDPNERFSMSFLAANLSQGINGVSRLHGRVSQEIFAQMWPGYIPEELNVGYVTNGVHFPTWTSVEWKRLYEKYFGSDFVNNQLQMDRWNKIYEVPDREIWQIRNQQRGQMIKYMKEYLRNPIVKSYQNPKYIVDVVGRFNKNILTIGFARRFATYKRAHLLFRNLDRLAKIVNNPEMPVQFIFAGKAHPADKAGQDLIKMIVEISKRPEFLGRIVFLQNYDMELAKHLVSGVDVWLNTPTRPLEASGTSGEKAVMNGVLHFSVLDGWWAEGYSKDAGWMLPEESAYEDHGAQDELDAETIYGLIENEIAPLYYFRSGDDLPLGWVRFIKNSIAKVASNFTTTRMFNDYVNRYYTPLYRRKCEIVENDFELAKELSSWKKKVFRSWESIEVLSVKTPDVLREEIIVGNEYKCEVAIDLNELNPEDIGVEFLIVEMLSEKRRTKLYEHKEFNLAGVSGRTAIYEVTLLPLKTGAFEFGIRMFPKNPALPHRQDFSLVKWI
ncbi:MAG: alpha-glucan family phosphorylase [Bacteroidales bacterium]|jgi:phosphorylase/glycogen(starch) synthase|nr:alpha-glucan family phosphorylase [Bacteroidales bacterium]